MKHEGVEVTTQKPLVVYTAAANQRKHVQNLNIVQTCTYIQKTPNFPRKNSYRNPAFS
jgi:hypothetical protein